MLFFKSINLQIQDDQRSSRRLNTKKTKTECLIITRPYKYGESCACKVHPMLLFSGSMSRVGEGRAQRRRGH